MNFKVNVLNVGFITALVWMYWVKQRYDNNTRIRVRNKLPNGVLPNTGQKQY